MALWILKMDAGAGATRCHGTRLEGFEGFQAHGPSVGEVVCDAL